ncbi:hypoxanthine-guanine phosphoribosyltransferase [Phtheirospermum japonicum]|uniref:Hypoxanthine phosphoribosyltransferase n=1 Tax=Phtheirospermum japonicum TaxID=374723 RepID=A0A830B165_9LAMI|nr:hypoxanthine-guanine phosphoribosyltransferase [Phtheirospermum japonicum]
MALDDHIERVIFTRQQISERVSELGSQITRDCKATPTVVVGVATGAILFFADLVRNIPLSITVEMIRVASYGSGTVSNGQPTISSDLRTDVQGCHVVLVEDIIDTGSTMSCLIDYMKTKGASSVSVCTLLDKPARRKVHFNPFGENGKYYCGFECPDEFVVGYGMDYAEVYRNLPYVGVLKPEIYK